MSNSLPALKVKSSSEWYFDSDYSRHTIGDKSFFTSLKDYNGGIVIFGDGSLACVKYKGNISILSCPKLDAVLYVDRFKVNLLTISQICDKDHRVIFFQNLCEVVNKERKVIIIGHRIVGNRYAIILTLKHLLCAIELDFIELWHRRLGHINYRDLVHLVHSVKVKDILELCGEPKPICGKCMKGK